MATRTVCIQRRFGLVSRELSDGAQGVGRRLQFGQRSMGSFEPKTMGRRQRQSVSPPAPLKACDNSCGQTFGVWLVGWWFGVAPRILTHMVPTQLDETLLQQSSRVNAHKGGVWDCH